MTQTATPCEDSDAWFVEGTPPVKGDARFDKAHRNWDNLEALLRARLTCLARCRVRQACMVQAMAYGEDNDHWVWGGYTGAERTMIRQKGYVKAPKQRQSKLDTGRLDEFLDYHLSFAECAERWGLKNVRSVYRTLTDHLWALRDGDEWTRADGDILPEPVSLKELCGTSPEPASSVTAA